MNHPMKNKIVTALFFLLIWGFMLGNMFTPDVAISSSERRKLKQAPSLSTEKVFSGEFFTEFDKYSLDQFVLRDGFRGIKAYTKFNLLRQKDNNEVYIVDGFISKMDYPLNEKSVLNGANKLNQVYDKFLRGMNTSYAIIPDKNYFLASENGYLSIDYDRMEEIMQRNVANMNYIDLFDALTIEDYYKTDIHWSQDRIIDIADKILLEMGNTIKASDMVYTEKSLYPFYGSFYGQAALHVEPDTLTYLTNTVLENATVLEYPVMTNSKVYIPEYFDGVDSYDVFLSGAKPLLTIENPSSDTDRGLLLFRDSFGSSVAPLLLSGYARITLIDLRYIIPDLLEEYIDFSQYQDALFLYNTQILNNSYMLK